jgi:hypothetical protein
MINLAILVAGTEGCCLQALRFILGTVRPSISSSPLRLRHACFFRIASRLQAYIHPIDQPHDATRFGLCKRISDPEIDTLLPCRAPIIHPSLSS